MQLADCRKKCITKFGWCRGSQGRRRGALCVGQSWDKSRGPGSLETLSQWAFPWEAQAGRNLFAFLLLSWATEILPAGHAPPVLDSQSLVQLTIFWIQILIIIVFSYSVSLFPPKQAKEPANWKTSLKTKEPVCPNPTGQQTWYHLPPGLPPGQCLVVFGSLVRVPLSFAIKSSLTTLAKCSIIDGVSGWRKFPVREKRLTVDISHQGLWFQDNGIWTRVGPRPFYNTLCPINIPASPRTRLFGHLIKSNGLKIMSQLSSYLIHPSQIGRSKKHITGITTAHALHAKQLRRLSSGFIPLGTWMDKYFPIHPFSGLRQLYFIFLSSPDRQSVSFLQISLLKTHSCHLF